MVFSNETAEGWQQQLLTKAVPIVSNSTYVVSYHAPNGGYSVDVGYFAAGGVTNYPLRALANGEQGANGVFGVGPAGTFPSSPFSAANYWVDVVFQEALGPDTNAPVVTAVIPTNGATEVDVNTSVQVTFNEAMATGTIDAGTIRLLDGTSNVVSAVVSYEEGSFTATLTPSAALSLGETYTGQVLSNVTDEAGNPMGTNYLWSFTTELPDTTAPEVLEVSPTNGAEEVSVETTVQVVFNEAMDPASITTNTVVLLDESSNVVAATVSYDGGGFTATLTPTASLSYSQTFSVRAKGGAGGLSDTSGNWLSTDYTWTFTTRALYASSIWEEVDTPALLSADEGLAVEVGVKFESFVPGYVTGMRFYKAPTNTGTHVGNLWTLGGSNLASVVFSNETSSGWQQQLLPTRVSIESGTTYVVSYHAPNGGYSATLGEFSGAGVTNYPLRALPDGNKAAMVSTSTG